METNKLKRGDLDFIRNIKYSMNRGYDGIGVKGAKVRRATRLVKMGYLKCLGYGSVDDEDYDGDHEYPIYALTAIGETLVETRE